MADVITRALHEIATAWECEAFAAVSMADYADLKRTRGADDALTVDSWDWVALARSWQEKHERNASYFGLVLAGYEREA